MTIGNTLMEVFAGQAQRAVSPELGLAAHINCDGNLDVTLRPPSFKPLSSITSPVEYLKRFKLSLDFRGGFSYLDSLHKSVHFLKLYQHYFPLEYASSTASIYPVIGSQRAEEGNGVYSPREIEFLELVNERLFPINLDLIIDDSWEGGRPNVIPLEYHGFEIEDPDYDGCRYGWQLVASLFFWYQPTFEDTKEGRAYARVYEKLDDAKDYNFNLLFVLCNAEDAPLQLEWLPLAYDVLDHDTGNLFIDPDYTYPVEDAYWSDGISIIDRLAQEHIEAHEIMDKCNILMDWIEASPKNFRKVVEVCNQSKSKPQEKSRLGVKIKAMAALEDLLINR